MDGHELTQEEPAPTENGVQGLEYRIRRLEDAVAGLQDTRLLEERVAERVGLRLGRLPALPQEHPSVAAPVVVDASRRLLPLTIEAIHSTSASQDPGPIPSGGPMPPGKSSWWLLDAYREFQAALRMYLDPGYRVSWSARLVPLGLLVLIATSWIWLPGALLLPGVMGVLYVKVIDLVLAFILYKFLSREARRFLDYEAARYRRF